MRSLAGIEKKANVIVEQWREILAECEREGNDLGIEVLGRYLTSMDRDWYAHKDGVTDYDPGAAYSTDHLWVDHNGPEVSHG